MYLIHGGLLTCGLNCLIMSVSLCVRVHENVHVCVVNVCVHVCVRWTFACMWACGHVCRWANRPICACTNVTIPSGLSCSCLCSAKGGSWATVSVRASWDQRIVAFPTWAPGTRRWAWNRSLACTSRVSTALQVPWSQSSSLQSCETITFCYLICPVCGPSCGIPRKWI